MASVSGDAIRPMFQDALEMLRLTWASFRRPDVSALEKAATLGESIHTREKELTRLLLAQSAPEQLRFVPGHLERIGDAIEGLLRCLHTMQAEGTLFTDRGVREVNRLFGKAVELLECARDLMLTGNRVLAAHASGEIQHDPGMNTLVAPIAGGAEILTQVLRALDAEGVTVEDIGLRRPTLDDVFLTITGRHAEEETTKDGKPGEPGGER